MKWQVVFFLPWAVYAQPSGEVVVEGSAHFDRLESALHITLLETSLGNITVNSSRLRADGATLQDLTVGTALGNANILTVSGNIQIGGSICGNAFNNVFINDVANPFWTSGTILARACTNLDVNDSISTSGLGSFITLIADNNLDGSGALNINANVTTINGPLSLSAGILGAGCLPFLPCGSSFNAAFGASINHNAGTLISCTGSGSCLEVAMGNININGAAVSVSTVDGSIHMFAGNDINIFQDIQNTALGGDILLTAFNNINLTGAAIASLNPVTLVVDSVNPTPPNIGGGAFNMDAASSITGAPLRIFTALQNQNLILGSLNSSFFPNPPGTLFQDYALEQWCTYFSCGFPYPFSALGVPFTVFYKNCLQQIVTPANLVVSELLIELNPSNEWLAWPEEFLNLWKFLILYDHDSSLNEWYWIQRRRLHLIHEPLINRSFP